MFIAGLIPYIRDTFGEHHLRPLSADAVDRHSDSVYDQATNQIYSTTDVWINSSLALNDVVIQTRPMSSLYLTWPK
jgi:hypothetical protein